MSQLHQSGLFEGPPARPAANPAPRLDVPETPPPPPRMAFSRIGRDWHRELGDVHAVDILADHVAGPVGRLVRGLDDRDDEWFVETDDEEFVHVLPDTALGRRLRDARAAVIHCVEVWAHA